MTHVSSEKNRYEREFILIIGLGRKFAGKRSAAGTFPGGRKRITILQDAHGNFCAPDAPVWSLAQAQRREGQGMGWRGSAAAGGAGECAAAKIVRDLGLAGGRQL